MNSFFAYIRVSTVKQGETGSSLSEQRDAINGFAARHNLIISAWFEEMETAAKHGRREFTRMMSLLKRRKASGVIFHKIDRGARNLKDWSSIQDLFEYGIDVRFAHESLDLNSRGGRLTADLLAVIAADYVRNLRDEVRKGIEGRLKQGLYPWHAPIGYLDQGRGKAKAPDPITAPLVRAAFELYASGGYSLQTLSDEMHRRGLRNSAGKKVDRNRLSELLRRPFYIGVIRVQRAGRTYPGVHEPIVPTALFDRVQAILDGKMNAKTIRHDFLFRRLIRCAACTLALIGERQKGHVYYRCHTKGCSHTCIREEVIEEHIARRFRAVELSEIEAAYLQDAALKFRSDASARSEAETRAAALALANLEARLSRLTDAFIDGAIERPIFDDKRARLLAERAELERESTDIDARSVAAIDQLVEFLELAKGLCEAYKLATIDEKRVLLRNATSNLSVHEKNVEFTLRSPFDALEKRSSVRLGPHHRDRPRTEIAALLGTLHLFFETKQRSQYDAITA